MTEPCKPLAYARAVNLDTNRVTVYARELPLPPGFAWADPDDLNRVDRSASILRYRGASGEKS